MPKSVVKAHVLAIVKRGSENQVTNIIQKIGGLKETLVTYGVWDLIDRIETESLEKCDERISHIRHLPEIESTNTLIGISH